MTPFPKSLINIKKRKGSVKNGTANFGRNVPTEISGPPPEVIPNITETGLSISGFPH